MRKLILILLLAFLAVGCSGTIKNSWTNFRAYYNTYYNAEANFKTGLNKVQKQPVTLDPSTPVRLHLPPIQAGNEDFENAIDKGAQILRKFPDSKWTDDALLLIGKSYYYQQEFYSALEKFEELQNIDPTPEMKQLAIVWKGRTLLDLEQYSEGVAYLETELAEYPPDWSRERRGEIEAVAAEHHAMLENWEQASELLSNALTRIKDTKLLGRIYFLYGQMLERLERYGEAQYAFSKVGENFPGFEYAYWAKIKQAEVARKEGNLDLALSVYENLWKDDKNFERRDAIAFEIARTMELKGQIDEAEDRYKRLLYDSQGSQERSLKSAIYYRLGKINSEEYNNYNLAAAYFDSSSSMMEVQNTLDDTQNAQSLSDAFGSYTKFQETIQRADSLLWLGSLPKAELDSVLAVIRQQKRRELLEQQQDQSQDMLANRNIQAGGNNRTTSSSVYGFLNYQNAELVNQAKAEFRITWGNRPLIDNWRRMEIVQQTNVSGDTASRQTPKEVVSQQNNASDALNMDLSEIPTTQKQKDGLKAQKEKAQFELGNLLFLNLNMPDSARYYFHKVINNNIDDELRPRAMYSLYELFNAANNQDSLQYWEDRILNEYPKSKFARRILDKTRPSAVETTPDSAQIIIEKYQEINQSPELHKGPKLRSLALANRSSDVAPYIYYRAIESYVGEARAYQAITDSLQPQIFELSTDSLFTGASGDSTASDSTQIPFEERFTFSSVYWDSVRILIQEFDTTFANSSQQSKVAVLRDLLEQPEKSAEAKMPTCESLGITLSVQPGMDEFLSTITYPQELANQSLSGEVTYSFVITSDGEFESYELVSNRTSLGIEDSFEAAFDKSLQFAPIATENAPPKMKCEVTFPIQQ